MRNDVRGIVRDISGGRGGKGNVGEGDGKEKGTRIRNGDWAATDDYPEDL